ncbi:MAG: hypothetical protein ACMUIL_02785 [bacterium]
MFFSTVASFPLNPSLLSRNNMRLQRRNVERGLPGEWLDWELAPQRRISPASLSSQGSGSAAVPLYELKTHECIPCTVSPLPVSILF